MTYRITSCFHEVIHLTGITRQRYALLKIHGEEFPLGVYAGFSQFPLDVAHRLAGWLDYNRQPVLFTEAVRDSPDFPEVGAGCAVILAAFCETDGIQHDMVMYVPLVNMSSEYDLVIWQVLLYEFIPDLMSEFGTYFAPVKSLYDVECLDTVAL